MNVEIDEKKCVGCGICADICSEGIVMERGKARIINEDAGCIRQAAESCPNKAILVGGRPPASAETESYADVTKGLGQGSRIGAGRGRERGLGMGAGRGRGRGRGGMGGVAAGPGGTCLCPDCGFQASHQLGQPCYQLKCPRCGSPLRRA